jgi:aspartate carbamoyltransferase
MDIISVDQFDRTFIENLIACADYYRYEYDPTKHSEPLRGKVLANLFYEPSTRTSSSFYSAMVRLGGSVIPINEVRYSSVVKGEKLEDTVRTLSCYADVIVLRHSEVGAAQRAADVIDVPVINAGDGTGEHPTQALLDLYTIFKERGSLDGLHVVMVGDLLHGRTVHSLSKLLRLYGAKISFVAPDVLQIPDQYIMAGETKYSRLDDVIATADVVYMTRVQKERFATTGTETADDYGITVDHMAAAKSDMVLMHPLPRVTEIPAEIDPDPRAAYFRQMRHGLFMRMALLAHVVLR